VRVVPKVGDQKTSSVRIEEALEDDQR
jgi:hypothetical protein